MREAFKAAGAPSPGFPCWTRQGDPETVLASGLAFPLVVKPVDNMGARGVRRVDDAAGLVEACRAALPLSRSSRVIVEEYMEGRELSLDAIVYRGEVTVCGIADRDIFFPPWFVEMGHTIPTELDGATAKEIARVFEAGIHAIGIDNGAAKGDIKLTPRGVMIGEIAARLSGGYMSGWTYPLSSGVEVTEAALNIAVGLPPANLAALFKRTCAERAIISIPGVVEAVEGEDDARGVAGVEHVFLRVAAGDEVQFPSNNVQKCGNVIAAAESRSDAVTAARKGICALSIRLRPRVEKTMRYIFHENGHDAFASLDGTTRKAIGDLPPFRGDPLHAVAGAAIAVAALPGFARLQAEDWHGLLLADAVRQALLRGGGIIAEPGTELGTQPGAAAPFMLSGLFWRAMLRGSVQGGVFLLDSIRAAAALGRLPELLAEA